MQLGISPLADPEVQKQLQALHDFEEDPALSDGI